MERLQEGTGVATDLGELQDKLWEAADQLRANSGLKASEYASPVLGHIFLRYADERFTRASQSVGPGSARRPTGPEDYWAIGALYLPEECRFERLLDLPEGADRRNNSTRQVPPNEAEPFTAQRFSNQHAS